MADYKITEDSLKEENGQLRCMVTFYDDDGNEAFKKWWEVAGAELFLSWSIRNGYQHFEEENAPRPPLNWKH